MFKDIIIPGDEVCHEFQSCSAWSIFKNGVSMTREDNMITINDCDPTRAPIRLAILQRVCTGYRLGLFRKLSAIPGCQMRTFLGDDLPNTKVRSAADLSSIDVVRLPTRFVQILGRIFVVHKGLVKALADFQPDVILCEGESSILSYLKAIWYRRKHPNVALVHWSLGDLPGETDSPRCLRSRIKYFLQKRFDAFVVYSSYGKECLVAIGHSPDKIFIATNVADTSNHLKNASLMTDSPSEARAKLGMPDRFTVFYAGAMTERKCPGLLLDVAQRLDPEQYNFVLLGNGPLLETLQSRVEANHLHNVFLPGRVENELPLYYRASDVMVLPGRGGMVMSEAMAWSLPVIVHQADGTEYDLVRNDETGIRLENGKVGDFQEAIELLKNQPEKAKSMGRAGKELLVERFTTIHMVSQMTKAMNFALAKRRA